MKQRNQGKVLRFCAGIMRNKALSKIFSTFAKTAFPGDLGIRPLSNKVTNISFERNFCLPENFFSALLGAAPLRGVSCRRVRSGERAYGRWLPMPPYRCGRSCVLRLPLPLRAPRGVLAPLPACGRRAPSSLSGWLVAAGQRAYSPSRTHLVAPAPSAAPSGADFFRQAKNSVATVSTLATWSPAAGPRRSALARRKSLALR